MTSLGNGLNFRAAQSEQIFHVVDDRTTKNYFSPCTLASRLFPGFCTQEIVATEPVDFESTWGGLTAPLALVQSATRGDR